MTYVTRLHVPFSTATMRQLNEKKPNSGRYRFVEDFAAKLVREALDARSAKAEKAAK